MMHNKLNSIILVN